MVSRLHKKSEKKGKADNVDEGLRRWVGVCAEV